MEHLVRWKYGHERCACLHWYRSHYGFFESNFALSISINGKELQKNINKAKSRSGWVSNWTHFGGGKKGGGRRIASSLVCSTLEASLTPYCAVFVWYQSSRYLIIIKLYLVTERWSLTFWRRDYFLILAHLYIKCE